MINKINEIEFGEEKATVYELKNGDYSVKILDVGARILEINCPDRHGRVEDITIGYKNAEDYLKGRRSFYGATIGRYANRISGGSFRLNGKDFELSKNEKLNTLHGGANGFDTKKFSGEIRDGKLVLTYFSKDGEEGFPGNLLVKVKYSLTEDNGLKIEYYALSDRDTVCNLTNHAFFNLSNDGDVLNSEVKIFADKITEPNEFLIPTGKFVKVKGTDLDFNDGAMLKDRIKSDDGLIKRTGCFDFNYCVNGENDGTIKDVASVYDKDSGRILTVRATMPGVQFYFSKSIGNFSGKRDYASYSGLCLEPQYYPDSPNQSEFPSVTLKAGEVYNQTIIFGLSVK